MGVWTTTKLASVIFVTFCCLSCNQNSKGNFSELTQLVENWNKANVAKDIGVLSNLYSSSILYYGTIKDKNYCLDSKLTFYKRYPDFYQQIFGDIQVEKISDSEFKCSFVKRVTINKKTSDYPSFLIFTNENKSWKITTEGDLVTDKNLAKAKGGAIPDDAIKGDFNGDGVLDYAWLIKPKIDSEGMGCVGDCVTYIKFSDESVPLIKVSSCIGGKLDNLGDLNNNGTDEVGLAPEWFTSCWSNYYVWTLANQWIYAVEPIFTHCNQWEQGIKPIEADPERKGYVIIRYSEMTDADIETKSKSVRIK